MRRGTWAPCRYHDRSSGATEEVQWASQERLFGVKMLFHEEE